MALTFNAALANAQLGNLDPLFDGASLEIWDDGGAGIPVDGDGSTVGHTLLSTVIVPTPAFNAPAARAMTAAGLPWNDIDDIDATGTAVYFRLKAVGGEVIQGSVGVGSGDLQVDTVNFVLGGAFSITGFTLNQ